MFGKLASSALRVCSKQATCALSRGAPTSAAMAFNPFRIVVPAPAASQVLLRQFHSSPIALFDDDGYSSGPSRRDGDWDCPSCGAMVFASKRNCFKCGSDKNGAQGYGGGGGGGGGGVGGGRDRGVRGGGGGGGGMGNRRDGDWTCPSCNANCFASKTECFRCDTPNPNPNSGGASAPASDPVDPGGLNGTGTMTGTVASWNSTRGFGFITPSDGGDDVFCHFTNVQDGNALGAGLTITFDLVYDEEKAKDQAMNVAGGVQEFRGGGGGDFARGGGGGGGGSRSVDARRDGDWDCAQCGAMVFASRGECFKCGAAKPGAAANSAGDDAAW